MSWLGDIFTAQPKQFRYTLVTDSDTYVLPNAPIGWEENIIRWSRSEFYYGMIRSFSVPLQFVLDGAWILRTGFYTFGLRSYAQLQIEELNLSTWAYEVIYTGEIDFSTFSDKLTDVTVTAMEGGISAKIKAYENVKYTIPIDVADAIDIELTPLKLRENATFIFPEKQGGFTGTSLNRVLLPVDLIINEVQGLEFSSKSVEYESLGVPLPDMTENPNWFFKALSDGNINISGNLIGGNLGIQIINQDGVILEVLSVDTGDFDIAYDVDIPVVTGDRLFFIGIEYLGAKFISEGEFLSTYLTETPATFCKALRPIYVFQQLLNKMNGNDPVSIQSFLLQEWEQLTITSGQAIRRQGNPVLILSFRDFFTSINAVLNVGFGIIQGKAVLEKKSFWFQSTLKAADVGENKEFNLELYEPYIYNSIKVGYPDPKFSTIVDNNDEVNSTQFWSDPIIRVQKELDLTSIIRADCYGIEDTRITPLGSPNTNNDNDAFFIKIKADPESISGDPYYRPERSEGYVSLSGVLAAETFYNWDISPKRNLLRHGDFLRSMLYNYDQFFINFESALKNSKMSVVGLDGVRVTENVSISIGNLPDIIFIPYLITIVTKLPKNAMALVDNYPTGYIRSTFNDSTQYGFMIDVSVDVSKNRQRELKLLLTPFNQLGNLIR
jgi:hypothetical protein